MSDDKPTPQEAQAVFAKIFAADGVLDVGAYKLAGGMEGVTRLQRQAAAPPAESTAPAAETPPPADQESEPIDFSAKDWKAKYLTIRSQLFDADARRRGKK